MIISIEFSDLFVSPCVSKKKAHRTEVVQHFDKKTNTANFHRSIFYSINLYHPHPSNLINLREALKLIKLTESRVAHR